MAASSRVFKEINGTGNEILYSVLSILCYIAFYMEISPDAMFITKFIALDKVTFPSIMVSRHMRRLSKVLSNPQSLL